MTVDRSEPSGRAAPSIHSARRLDEAVAFRIHRTNRLLLTQLARFLETNRHGLTPEKWFVLARIRNDGPMRQTDLVDPTLGDGPNVSRLVDGLVRAGLAERSPDPTDRRSRILTLTDEGAELADHLHDRSVSERERVFDGLSADDLTTLCDALDRIDANLRPALGDREPN